MMTVDSLLYPSPSLSDVIVHIVLTLVATALWVYFNRQRSFIFLALAMFFPTVFALGIHVYHGSLARFISFLLFNPRWSTLYWSVYSSLLSVVIVLVCCLMNYAIGWGTFPHQRQALSSIHEHNRQLIHGWLRALGEEIGWRSYLLPGLLTHFHPILALNISGLVWGLYHVPIMVLLSYQTRSKVAHPLRSITVQCLSCWISAIVYGWIAIRCHYSMIPPTMMHFIWNRVNPWLLGSIYTNTPGWMHGEQWKINGEGLMGCIVDFFIALIILVQFI
jgi:membrane protease YdiL (CAAX protease family)